LWQSLDSLLNSIRCLEVLKRFLYNWGGSKNEFSITKVLTMKIILKDTYKSLRPFESEELNRLTIITGKNGSGKSQILELINKKSKKEASVASINLEISPSFEKIQAEGIIKESSIVIGHEHWKNIINNLLSSFKSLSQSSKQLINFIIENKIQTNVPKNHPRELYSQSQEYKELISKVSAELFSNHSTTPIRVTGLVERRVLSQIYIPINERLFHFIKEICTHTGKAYTDLTDADFFNTPIQEKLIDSNDLFSSQIELIFYNYAKRRNQNRQNYFYKKEEGEENNSVSDEEFLNTFTPPWQLINDILNKHNIDFYFKGIEKKEFTIEVSIDIKIYKKSTNEAILFNDLSSGEKVIIGLIMKLFTSEYYGQSLAFPDLLILDEPDAHLHPEMSKLLLEVLEETFVNKYGINVIISTHSPSTIALASENQIFQLTNGANSALKKISKDEALKLLTGFLPTLSIDYKNHRQVFVESPTDVNYYQYLYNRHRNLNAIPFNLYFISNSAGKGNCTQVYKIVQDIRKSGNTTSYGIVDWDLTNKPEEYIYVHGMDERYSVENFILDPIYLICLLIDLNNAHGICEKIGIDKTYNQYLLGNEKIERLQKILEYFFTEFERKFPAYKYDSKKTSVSYLNGNNLEIPEWYLKMNGHEIVDKIKIIFTSLAGKYKNEGEIQKELTIIMAKCYPFVPLTSIKIIEQIGGYSK
jgi:predicted ATPase